MKNATFSLKLLISPIAILFICCISPEHAARELTISPLHPFEEIETVNTNVQKYKYFIVDSFQDGNKEQFKQIDNYIKKNLDKDYGKFSKYVAVFYKESGKLRRNFRQTESDRLMWHGEDIIFSFEWSKGVFAGCEKYKEGKIVGTMEVE